jgi:predicted PurR-regulated permease PerM
MLNFFKPKEGYVTISPSIIIFTIFFVLGLFFLYQIKSILVLLFLSFIIVVALRPTVLKLQRVLKFPKIVSIITVYTLFILFLASLISFILPPLVTQLYQLLKTIDFPLIQDQIKNFQLTTSEITSLAQNFGSSISVVVSIITSTFSGIFTFVTLLIMSFYLMLDRPKLHEKLYWFTKNKSHVKILEDFINSLEHQLGGWVRGQIILMSLIGVITYTGLTLLKIPYAMPLALLAALLEVVPNLGPTIAAIPAIIIAFIYISPAMALAMLAFYILIQQLENNIIVPKIMKDSADVNPLVAITSILTGMQLFGVVGALLAVPVYIVIRTTFSTWKKVG